MIRFTLTNHTLGGKYTRQFKTEAEVNKWINWVQTPEDCFCPYKDAAGNCTCRVTIKVEDTIQ